MNDYITKFLVLMTILTALQTTAQDILPKDVKNISYASSKLKILPLFKLKNIDLIDGLTIIFPHIPKVGGTSLLQTIEPQSQISSKRFSVPRIKNVSPSLTTPNWLGSYSKHRLINGHFPYGVHQFITNKYRYIALVRSPLDREISALNFDYQRGFIKNKDDAHKYLFETTLDNPQVRMLAGKEHMSGECNEQTLNIAKANIDKNFLFIGVTEDTDSFIQVMLTLLKLSPVATTRA